MVQENIKPNAYRIENMNNGKVIYVLEEDFDFIKYMLSINSAYEKVYISPKTNIVYRAEEFKKCI